MAISPRGANDGLSWSDEHQAEFPYEEAGYFGNLFLPAEQRVLAVCGGEGLVSELDTYAGGVEPNQIGDNFVEGRLCGTGSCGLLFVGYCNGLGGEEGAAR